MAIAKSKMHNLYLGAFKFYFNRCQFQSPELVQKFCDLLVKDWDKLPNELKDIIVADLAEAWEKEKDYGKNNPVLSPFGNNQIAWTKVIKKAFDLRVP